MNRDENRKKEKAEEKIEHVQPVNTTQDVCKEKNEQMENIGNKVGKEEFDHKKEKKGKGAKITKEELKELQNKAQELDALKDNFLRKIADFENAKKRLIKEKEEFAKFANEKIVAAFLPVLDNLDRALVHSENLVTTDALLAGIQLIKKQIDDILKNNGLSKIEAIGKQFDPHMHEAIGVVSTDDHPADTVVEEIQCGYMFKDKLLRPSWVRIAEPSAVKELSTADTTHDTEDKGAEAREEKMPSSENNMADE